MTSQPERYLASDVAEIQGLYGSFTFPEKLLQQIWQRREFDGAAAQLADGRRVQVLFPGKWNRLGGPDFQAARLRFDDGGELTGDVELHLRAGDWDNHQHAVDPAYANVILHVVLFEPESGYATRSSDGRVIPLLVLLPLLHHDLEEYAADEAVERLANRPAARIAAELTSVPITELRAILFDAARARWRQKVRFAQLRVARLGWEGACHYAALETLGFRYNRSPMLRIAVRHPRTEWTHTSINTDAVYDEEHEAWSVQGVRPANHPRVRLKQYAGWNVGASSWPELLREFPAKAGLVSAHDSTKHARRNGAFPVLRHWCAEMVCAGKIGGTRLNNLVCDGFLPLLTAEDGADLFGVWFHWFPGDAPPFVSSSLRGLEVYDGREQPGCHGLGQGVLEWLIEREARR